LVFDWLGGGGQVRLGGLGGVSIAADNWATCPPVEDELAGGEIAPDAGLLATGLLATGLLATGLLATGLLGVVGVAGRDVEVEDLGDGLVELAVKGAVAGLKEGLTALLGRGGVAGELDELARGGGVGLDNWDQNA